MNIKSLFFGSALASVASTGAQAADAIYVPEPERVEYVRVCDVYGAGFFYIPGTEACLRVGGYARYEVNWDRGDKRWETTARIQPALDVRSESEFGTIRGFIELRGEVKNGFHVSSDRSRDDFLRVQQAFFEVGGLFGGLKTTLWDQDLSGEYDRAGYDERIHTLGYGFAFGSGVSFTVAAEWLDFGKDHSGDRNYVPNVISKLGVTQGWGRASALVARDSVKDAWNAKLFASLRVTEQWTLELMGTYASADNLYGVKGIKKIGDLEVGYARSAGGHLKYAVTPKLAVGFGGQYLVNRFGTGGSDNWAVGPVIDYELVKNLNVKLALHRLDGEDYRGRAVLGSFLRVQRDF